MTWQSIELFDMCTLQEACMSGAGYHPAVIRLDTGNTAGAVYTGAAGNTWAPDSNYRGGPPTHQIRTSQNDIT